MSSCSLYRLFLAILMAGLVAGTRDCPIVVDKAEGSSPIKVTRRADAFRYNSWAKHSQACSCSAPYYICIIFRFINCKEVIGDIIYLYWECGRRFGVRRLWRAKQVHNTHLFAKTLQTWAVSTKSQPLRMWYHVYMYLLFLGVSVCLALGPA